MKKVVVLALLAVSGLILLSGCGGGITSFIITPDYRIYSEGQAFNVVEAASVADHLIKVTVLIDNQTAETLPFTPGQAYLTTADKKAVYAGLPLKQGYVQLVPVALNGYLESGLDRIVSEQIDSSKNQNWAASSKDTLMPCRIAPHTAIKGNLWFKWTKAQTMQVKGSSEGALLDQGGNLLEAPLTLYVVAPGRDLIFLLKLKDSRGVNY